jgi:hypothetical protein
MRHVTLCCKKHQQLRWNCKSIAYTPGKGYNGQRNIFFQGRKVEQGTSLTTEHRNSLVPECDCPPSELTLAPEDKWANLSLEAQREAIDND